MSELNEEEIIEVLNNYKNCHCDLREYQSCIECENKINEAIQDLLDLYQTEKIGNANLQMLLDEEKEKNKELKALLKKQTELEQEKESLIKQGWLNE